jgi:hypothetical protein
LLDSINKDRCERKLNDLKRLNAKSIVDNRQKQDDVTKKLQLIISCENARLNQDYYMRMQEEDKIEQEDKERAKKLIENLKLDNL